jgi:TRAP-type C4-dicarboxylate transport system substrate-binding protein
MMRRNSIRSRMKVALGLLTVTALAVGGCTTDPATGTKAGGDPPPLTLRIGTDDPEGRPGSNQIEEFARQVKEMSEGTLRIEPVFQAAGDGQLAWDQKVARLVVKGDLDLGMIPARAWDTEGVLSLRPLNAPFLVSSDELMNAVTTDDELADEMLGGLESIGITGLALLPEGLRHLFGFGKPMVTPADVDGAIVRVPRSTTTWALFEAMGAEPTDREVDDTFAAAETSFALGYTLPVATAVLGNLTFYPKVNSLVANSERFESLTSEQQDILREAALAARDWALGENPSDVELAEEYCANGGKIVLADESDLEAFERSGRPVYDELNQDETTAGILARIEELKDQTPGVASVEACDPGEEKKQVTAENIVPDGGDLPDGTYRVEYTDDYLRDHGLNPEEIDFNHGVWTFTLEDGHWSWTQVADNVRDSDAGIYQVVGDDLYWLIEGEGLFHLKWTVDTDGNLSFDEVGVQGVADFQWDTPWTRID